MKTFILFCYAISCILLGLGLLAYVFNPSQLTDANFNFLFFLAILIMASISFGVATPIFFTHMYSNTYNKSEKEIEMLKTDLRDKIAKNNKLTQKLVTRLIKFGEDE